MATDLDELNLLMVVWFKVQPIFTTPRAGCLKQHSIQLWPKLTQKETSRFINLKPRLVGGLNNV